ncbi:hypothetical protein ABT56_11190 [Photobacterium aquae]|uniref:Cadherin domain-containing protein n=1 Tax=Photobacterium aquae TaxID=1195763 RepID=A0A0J1H124_9GAMM|nr:retention module-containing protein [Photobacterium aquae]KLV05526.1 hypothetical protein ABT56_11190 [Photobacterium aquae]
MAESPSIQPTAAAEPWSASSSADSAQTGSDSSVVVVEQGTAVVTLPDREVVAVPAGYQLEVPVAGAVVFADPGTLYVVMKNGKLELVDWPCPTCVRVAPSDAERRALLAEAAEVSGRAQGDDVVVYPLAAEAFPDGAEQFANALTAQELESLQAQILAGEDPTALFEPPAAGIGAGETANGGFVVVEYDGDSTLTEAGFDTRYEREEFDEPDDPPPLFAAGGGETGSMVLTEGDFQPNTYPSTSSVMVTVSAASLPLDPAAFTFAPQQLAELLAELEAELTSSGQAIDFEFDPARNAIVGTSAGNNVVVTFQLTADSTGRDVDVTVTTQLDRPLDHLSASSGGLVSNINDVITVSLPIQGADLAGNALDSPIVIASAIIDGVDPLFGSDPGTLIDEADSLGVELAGAIPLDVGSDEINTLVFNPQQPDLEGLTSNGFATTLTVNGNQLLLVDSRGESVLTVTINTDGSYVVNLMQPIDELNRAELVLELAVVATDFDGDTATGSIVLNIVDGNSPPGGETGAITITEPDLQPDSYPGTGQDIIDIAPGIDRLDPTTVMIDELQLADLLAALTQSLSTGGNALSFSYDATNGVLSGATTSGELVVTLTLTAVQSPDGLGISVTADLVQLRPLDHLADGANNRYVSVDGEQIVILVPIQANDTDGDFLDQPAELTVTINDGVFPAWGQDSGAAVTDPDNTPPGLVSQANGSNPVDVGSDAVSSVVFLDTSELASIIGGLSSNGRPVDYRIEQNQLVVTDSQGASLLVVTINLDGSYQVAQFDAFDQPVDSNLVRLPIAVRVTDDDGDSADSQIVVTLQDGSDPAGGEASAVEMEEPDLEPNQYPQSVTATLILVAGADRLLPDSVTLDPAQLTAIIADLQAALSSAGQALAVSYDAASGLLVANLPDGSAVLRIVVTAVQAANGNDVAVSVVTTQLQPLDHLDSTVSSPYITTNGEQIVVSLPLQATDSDGDALVQPASVAVTINDGVFPALESGSGVSVNETQDEGQAVTGTIAIDKGSDDIASLLFAAIQPPLDLTSNGSPVSLVVGGTPSGSEISLVDGLGNTVLVVTLAVDGQYSVTLSGTLDHGNSESLQVPLDVVVTDNDGDQAPGQIVVTVTDGDDPPGGNTVEVTVVEPDLEPSGYPISATQTELLQAGADRLVPESVQIDPADVTAILTELEAELTSGGGLALVFSYDPASGILQGELADGTVVLTITLLATQAANGQDVELALTLTQSAPLDHNQSGNNSGFVAVNGDEIVVRLPVTAQDVDGDSLATVVTATATVVDGELPALLADSGVALNETADLNSPTQGQIGVDVGSDAVAAINFLTEQTAFDSLLSDGVPVQFEVVGGSTLNAFIVVDGNRQPVLTVVMTPTGTYTVTLSNNLDHLNGDTIELPLNVEVVDDDGDINSGTVTLTVADGDNPAFGADSGLALNEGAEGIVSGSGNIAVIPGSDDVISLIFQPSQPAFDGLTSNGFATDVTVAGNRITLVRADDPSIEVLTVTIALDGSYAVTQSQPLDQDVATNLNTLVLGVAVEDRDGDSATGTITVTVEDGVDPAGGNTSAIAFNEGDLSPGQGDQPYPVSGATVTRVGAGVDRLDPASLVIDPAQLAPLLAEFGSEVTAGGLAVTATWAGNTLTLAAGGETVLTAVVSAVQVTGSKDVDVSVTVTQFKPLDHNGTDNTGLVRQINDTLVFDLPLQLRDTDGDPLQSPALITTTISDGQDPVIEAIPALLVKESDIDAGGEFHPGSNPSGDEQAASGQIIFDSGSDEIIGYQVDVTAFNNANAGTLTAGGDQVILVFNTADNRYEGLVNGSTIFILVFAADGNFTFTLLGALDHVQPQNDTQLSLAFVVTALDQDGDSSAPATLTVTVDDDIPQTVDAAFQAIEEGSTTATLDILTVSQEGADDAAVTAVVIDGVRQPLTGTPDAQGFFIFDVNQSGQLLGQLHISAEGQVFFVSLPDVDHGEAPIVVDLGYEVTDGDNDISQSTLTITITDEEPTLVVQESQGVEDQGRNPDETIGDPTQGIPVNMTIDIGDGDRGEQIGEVFIVLPSEPHGDFYLNGTLLVPTGGQVQIPPAAFVDPDGDGNFDLQGVTFVPDADYSTFAEPGNLLDFTVTAQVVTTDGADHPLQNGTLSISVLGIADAPAFAANTVTYYGDGLEDGPNISLADSFQAFLQDTDGSEVLTYFITITEGEGQIIGDGITEVSPGVFEVPVASASSVALDPADNFSGDIRLTLTAQSRELGHFVPAFETAQTAETLLVNVLPVADDAQLKVQRVSSLEDEAIALAPLIQLTELDDTDDNFGVETLYVRISELPVGAQLLQNGVALVPDSAGVYEILYEELDQVQLIPVPESNVDFAIKVEGVVKDVVDITLEDGTVTTVEDVLVTPAQFIEVALTGVVDEPDFELGGSNWTDIVGGPNPGIETTIDEDDAAVLDFSLVSGEKINAPLDDSETLTFVLSNIPDGTRIFDAEGNEQTLVFVGFDPVTGLPRYEVKLTGEDIGTPGQPVAITIRPPENSTEDIVLDASIIVTENDGDQGEFEFDLVIHIEPVVDAGDYTRQSNGLEDAFIPLNWEPSLTDSKEVITNLVLGNIQPGYQLQIDNGGTITPLVIDATGSVTITQAQLAELLAGAQLQLLAPPDSDLNLTGPTAITTEVTVSETDVDSPATDTKVVNGTLNVIIRAVVEPDAELGVLLPGGTEFVENIVSPDGSLNLTGGPGSDGQIVFEDLDPSSDEVILSIVITFPDPDVAFVVIGAINNGDGSWTVPNGSLDDIQILAPEGFVDTVTVQLAAEVQDLSDDGDVSAIVEVTSNLTIDFQNNVLNDQLAAEIVVDQNVIVTGQEDTVVALGGFLNQIVSLDTSGGDIPDDEFSLVISAASLPSGATIAGMDFNFVTNEYVIKVTPQADGSLDLTGISLNLPQDFAGDFLLDVKYVNTDVASGDTKEVTDTIPVRVDPVVDVPDRTGDPNRAPDIGVTVVETQGLDADRQPAEDGEPEVVYPGIAYEDGTIVLDITATVADISTTTLEGLETLQQVVIDVGGAGGFLLNAAGEQVTSLTITDITQLADVRYVPPQDFSGEVSLSVALTIVDTAEYDQTPGAAVQTDTANFSGNVVFEVIAVNDEVEFSGLENPIVGDEDSGAISFAGISGQVVDIDGSESIVSIKIVNVPEGFIIDGAANNGGGEWSVAVPVGSTTFDLSGLGLIPPKDFSGSVELGIVVFSKEDSLELPEENTATFNVVVNPIADRVDTDVTPTASGTEDENIPLILNIQALDNSDSYTGTATNVTENPPETLQIQLSNVPDSSQIALPAGVAGSVSDQGGGVWLVTVASSDLAELVFVPGNANSNNWNGQLDIEIRAVDQTDVAPDPIAAFVTITLDIDAVNDAPVNQVPASLTVDEDGVLLINSLQVSDVDIDEVSVGLMTVTLSVANGILLVPPGSPLAGITVTGDGSNSLVLEGALSALNTLLSSGVNYQPDPNFNGDDSLQMVSNDQGNTGTGGPLQDSDDVPITVLPVNDPPVISDVPDQTTEEDTALVISGIAVSDVDFNEAGSSGVMTVSLTAGNGTLTVADTAGVTITDNGTGAVTLDGSLADINTALAAGVTYLGVADFKGEDSVTVTANDNGNVGAGGPQQASATINITVTPKAEPPILALTVPQMADTRAALGILVPLLGLAVSAADADEALFVEVRNLGDGRLVDTSGANVGVDNGDGSWRVAASELDGVFVADLPEGQNTLTVVGISQESDGSEAESTELLIGIRMDNLTTTGNDIGAGDSDSENLVVGGSANERLFGGLADDILVGGTGSDQLFGGAGNDQLWGGELNGTGDGAADIFVWQVGDVGTAGATSVDTVKDMEIGLDQLNIAEILPDDGGSDLDRLINNIAATVADSQSLQLDVATVAASSQQIILENIDVAGLGLDTGSTSAEIVSQLFNNNTFIVD